MKPLIGIVMRNSLSESGKKIQIIYSDMFKSVMNSGGIAIGVSAYNIDDYLNICKGFIFQGGDDVDNDSLKAIKKLNNMNIPVLGICLGMQEMANIYDGKLYDVDGHKDTMHRIIINKNSLLYNIIGRNDIVVNSRHKSMVRDSKLTVSAISLDGVVEAVEDNNNRFFLGLQWHPENIYKTCKYAKKIFDYFIKICDDNYGE